MQLIDVNVLVYAHREDAPGHGSFHAWVTELLRSDRAFGMADLVLSGFLRIVTHPRIFNPPSPLKDALAFVEEILGQPHCVRIQPGPRHWEIFVRLCRESGARGNLVPDAYLAAMAIESGSEWVTSDRDFGRFPGLRWCHPLHRD